MSTAISSRGTKKARPSIPTVRSFGHAAILCTRLDLLILLHIFYRGDGTIVGPDDGNLHLQLNLPRCHPYVQPEIVANPIIEQVAGAVLHGLVYIRYINGNTACRTTSGPRFPLDTAFIVIRANLFRSSLLFVVH